MELLTYDRIPELLRQGAEKALADTSFSQEYPDELLAGPTIVWSLYRRVPGKLGDETRKPRFREVYEQPETGRQIIFYGQWMTCVYQFDIVANSNSEVNKLTNRFDMFVKSMTQVLWNYGVDYFIFDEQLQDPTIKLPPNAHYTSLRYMCVYNDITRVPADLIRDITIHMKGDLVGETIEVTRGTSLVDTIPLTGSIHNIVTVSDSTSGSPDYLYGIDFDVAVKVTEYGKIYTLTWLQAGRKPAAGASYYIEVITSERIIDTSVLDIYEVK